MSLALFVPPAVAVHLRQLFPGEEICAARSWSELEAFISASGVTAAVVDPCADGSMNIDSVIRLMSRARSVRFFACVPPTASQLQAVFKLSKHGLQDAFVHPTLNVDLRLFKSVTATNSDWLIGDFLARIETRLGALSPELFRTVRDLFDRPHRYRGVADIAAQAGMSVRKLYRRLDRGRIGTPTKLITAAKVLRGYAVLRSSNSTLGRISELVGFDSPRHFSRRTMTIFGCSPMTLRDEPDAEEIMLHLFDWVYHPSRRAR